jgi:hypothetical protein
MTRLSVVVMLGSSKPRSAAFSITDLGAIEQLALRRRPAVAHAACKSEVGWDTG